MNSGMIAGGGFAAMAWELAHRRTRFPAQRVVLDRLCASMVPHGPSAEYYRIIDRAWEWWNGDASGAVAEVVTL